MLAAGVQAMLDLVTAAARSWQPQGWAAEKAKASQLTFLQQGVVAAIASIPCQDKDAALAALNCLTSLLGPEFELWPLSFRHCASFPNQNAIFWNRDFMHCPAESAETAQKRSLLHSQTATS